MVYFVKQITEPSFNTLLYSIVQKSKVMTSPIGPTHSRLFFYLFSDSNNTSHALFRFLIWRMAHECLPRAHRLSSYFSPPKNKTKPTHKKNLVYKMMLSLIGRVDLISHIDRIVQINFSHLLHLF